MKRCWNSSKRPTIDEIYISIIGKLSKVKQDFKKKNRNKKLGPRFCQFLQA